MAERRTYTIPLRRGFQRTERYQRAKKAVTTLREFLQQHMKTEDVKLSRPLNESLWSRGIRKPPARVTVVCEKDDDGVVHATLEGLTLPSDTASKDESSDKKDKKASKGVKSE